MLKVPSHAANAIFILQYQFNFSLTFKSSKSLRLRHHSLHPHRRRLLYYHIQNYMDQTKPWPMAELPVQSFDIRDIFLAACRWAGIGPQLSRDLNPRLWLVQGQPHRAGAGLPQPRGGCQRGVAGRLPVGPHRGRPQQLHPGQGVTSHKGWSCGGNGQKRDW